LLPELAHGHVLHLEFDCATGPVPLSAEDDDAGHESALASRLLAGFVLLFTALLSQHILTFLVRCFVEERPLPNMVKQLVARGGFDYCDALRYITTRYRQQASLRADELVTMVLHIDHYQFGYYLQRIKVLKVDFMDAMVALPGEFLTRMAGERTVAAECGVILLPVLTGMTREVGGGLALVADYSVRCLHPFLYQCAVCCLLVPLPIAFSSFVTYVCHLSRRPPSRRSSAAS
jgi:hypothetical protein